MGSTTATKPNNKLLTNLIFNKFKLKIKEIESKNEKTFFSNHGRTFLEKYKMQYTGKTRLVFSDRTQMFELFKKPQINIYRNIIGIVYLLYFNNETFYITINDITGHKIIFNSLHKDEKRYSTRNDKHYKEEIQKMKSLYYQVRPSFSTSLKSAVKLKN